MKKTLESLKGSKFELSKDELNVQGGRPAQRGGRFAQKGIKSSYRFVDTAPELGGGCDKELADLCYVF